MSRKRSGHHSQESKEYRGWYSLARWKNIRCEQLAAFPLCQMCSTDDKPVPANTVDHVVPHRGDPELFWNGPFQSLCSDCHDRRKRLIELRGYEPGCDENGRPRDAGHPWNRT
jgi:5-methylcytosine-specific restriction endonuclease McrA